MKPEKRNQLDTLERALVHAHALREAPAFSQPWREAVMRDIRLEAGREKTLLELPNAIWRAAAMVALVSAVFVGSALTWNAGQTDFSALFTMATADSTLMSGAP
jgi:hypothetical protein